MVVWESLDALSHELELCRVGPDTSVVVVMAQRLAQERVDLIRAAVARTGADAIEVRPLRASMGANRDGSKVLTDAVTGADLVIVAGDRRAADDALGASNTDDTMRRVLYLAELDPQEFPPHASLRRRVTALRQLADDGATTMSLVDPHGTDLVIELSDSVVSADHGFVDDEAPTAQFPAGWVAVTPAASSVSGQLVVMPGDANLGAARMIASPVVLHIADDYVSTITGESPDADVLRALLEYPDDPNAYGVAELSVGLNPGNGSAAPFDERLLDPTVSRLLAGVVTLSLGENLLADRPCDQRVTISLPGRDVFLGDLPVVLGGRLEGDYAPDVYEL